MTDRTTPKRGRPRRFSAETALDDALDLFWERGYRATTTRDLEAALGVTQSSLYNAFGSKRDLLMAAIDRYEVQVERELLGVLAEQRDGLDRVEAFFNELGRWVERTDHRGCLVVNLMAGETADEIIRARVVAYRAKIRRALHAALSSAMAEPQASRRTETLLAAVLGLHITARTGVPGEVAAMLDGVLAEIDGWR